MAAGLASRKSTDFEPFAHFDRLRADGIEEIREKQRPRTTAYAQAHKVTSLAMCGLGDRDESLLNV